MNLEETHIQTARAPEPNTDDVDSTLSVSDQLRDRHIFLIGSTGFLGKVVLYLILRRHVDVARIYCLIRPKAGQSAQERLFDEVLGSPVFDPLRENLGADALKWIFTEKIKAVQGDIGKPKLGISPDDWTEMTEKVDVVINSSGLVDFNPPLDKALEANALGIRRVVAAAEEWNAPLMHVSTCYVAGNQSGTIFESSDLVGWFPRKGTMEGIDFDPDREIDEGLHIANEVRKEAEHQDLQAGFRHEARLRLKREARNPDDPEAFEQALHKVKEKWINQRQSELGRRRAEMFGWSNVYTYTKSLGEQVVIRAKVPVAIVRPSVIESSIRYPFPGWNEGFNTTAPLAFLALKGQQVYPAGKDLVLDVIPVDLVASGMVAITAALLAGRHHKVYQLASGDRNPCTVERMVGLTGLYKRKYYLRRSRGNPVLNRVYAWMEPSAQPLDRYQALSAPLINRLAGTVSRFSRSMTSHGSPELRSVARRVHSASRAVEKQSAKVMELMNVFIPFTYYNAYRFRAENIRALYARMAPEDREAMPWDPEAIDWLEYWLEIHLKGLEKWVFPHIKSRLQKPPYPNVYCYGDLLELFDAATTNHKEETAFRFLSKTGQEEQYTYAEVRSAALTVADNLGAMGVQQGDPVALYSENRPEWGMCYFGILQAGAVSVPLDMRSTPREVLNLLKVSGARVLLISDKLFADYGDILQRQLPESVQMRAFREILRSSRKEHPLPHNLPMRTPRRHAPSGDALASIIFTSGTTGPAKGVMLTQRNFTSLVSAMTKLFRVTQKDRVLSVLPLHHTFEFSTGFLLPFSRGATITHIEELSAELIQEALRRHKITGMVGVPALWEALYHKVRSAAREEGAIKEALFLLFHWLTRWCIEHLGINPGPYFFRRVHERFGGRIRFLISGAAALPAEVQRGFDGLGIELYEGYGLTESAPVLTVNRPGHRAPAGSVGHPLPGIEITIDNPGPDGVGEILARGPNIMKGYFNDPQSTREVLDGGWLRTGDLGRMDGAGRLYIAGRKKDVIVDAAGKNIYPDEIEELYGNVPTIKELCVVGLPDGRGAEQVACLVVPNREESHLEDAELRRRIEAHFESVSSTISAHKRIKILRFREQPLPRTSTRKVKRKDVIAILERMLDAETRGGHPSGGKKDTPAPVDPWLLEAVAKVTGRTIGEIGPKTRFTEDLGMDSLIAIELLSALEEERGIRLDIQDLADVATIEGLSEKLRQEGSRALVPVSREDKTVVPSLSELDLSRLHEFPVPESVQRWTKSVLRRGQRWIYEDFFRVKVRGRAFIPMNRNVLVIANHCSHLDMGLVKHALGGYGEGIITLGAADYFFANGPRRFYFQNFTNVFALDRLNPSAESIRQARNLLISGYNLLLFPEGTRSVAGDLQPFKRGVGMMALRFGVDILPVYVGGTYEALPKGAVFPRKRTLEVRIGPPVLRDELLRLTRGMPPAKAQVRVAHLLQRAIECLRDSVPFDLQAEFEGGDERGSTLQRLFDDLRARFDPAEIREPVTWYFSLGPEAGHKWSVSATPEGCEIEPGRNTSADCVLKTSIPMFMRIVQEGYVPSMAEFMSGVVKTNDPERLYLFQRAFHLN